MPLQRNPIAGTDSANTSTVNSLQRNGFRIATSSKEQIQDGLNWWAGETGGTQLIIYSTKHEQGQAYPSGSGDYTPVAWCSFNDLSDAKVVELINGLPGRPANTQYTTLAEAVDWLQSTNQYFMMNQDYPFIKTIDPLVIWDPSVPQCSGFGVIGNNAKITQNLGNPSYINVDGYAPSTFQPSDLNLQVFYPNGGTAYGTFLANERSPDSVFHGNHGVYLASAYGTNGGWTATVVFKHTAVTNNEAPIFCLGDPSANGLVVFLTNPTVGPGTRIIFGNLGSINNINYSFSADTWYLLNVRYTQASNEIEIYINGSLEGSGPYTAGSYDWTSSHSLQIGGQRETGAIQPNTVSMEIGLFILDNRDSGSSSNVNYNQRALFDPSKINAKY
jgi:hypothetical protein